MRRVAATFALIAGLVAACADSGPDRVSPQPTTGNPAEAIAACLREKGWDVTAHPDNSVSASYPQEQEDQYRADHDACTEQVQPDLIPPMTEEQAEAYFDALLEVADCVRGLGYQVAEPPSRQAAVEALQQPIIDLGWDPYEDPVRNASTEEVDNVYRACPQPARPS